ncbi:MAG: glycoside hydrolase family 3 C-terminal domain-containing protein [Pseudomonadales bacterium]
MQRSEPPGGPDLEALLSQLTVTEKVALLAGRGMWVTMAIPRLGIPAIKVTDGPNGARGAGASGASAASFPAGSALASTWNTALILEVGRALGQEAKSKNAQVLLGPTVNLHRSPLGGRNFECYSEDPFLSGYLACAFIEGVQSEGVGACIKHFVCNDSEFQRHTISSDVDERTLREVYLVPFELAVRHARPWSVMSSYNRINDVYASSHHALLRDVLKGEWGFDGVVISDWGAALETEANLNGGLDLEMPGPTRTRGAALEAAVREGRVAESDIDDAARRMLRLVARSGRFAEPEPQPERSDDRPEHRAVARRAAAEGMVLLKNQGLLPLDSGRIRRLAALGPNAERGQIQGGGSSAVLPHYQVMPLEGLRRAAGWQVDHAPGCFNHKYLPMPRPGMLSFAGEPGARLSVFAAGETRPALERQVELGFSPVGGLALNMMAGNRVGAEFSARLEADLIAEQDGEHAFGLLSSGLARLYLDDRELIDNWDAQQPGDAFFGQGSTEKRAAAVLQRGRRYRYRIEFQSRPGTLISGIRYGILPPQPDDLLAQALDLAREADAVVLVAGSNADWETEGNDRTDLDLPGAQNELIEAVLEINPNTVVVLNTGAPVAMPWFDRAGAVVQAWLPGQEFGNALADVLCGTVNPSGRLPCTIPKRLQDTPAFTSYPGESGHVLYAERAFVGYRWYDARAIEPLLAFGHGLSYTEFAYHDLRLTADRDGVRVRVEIENRGERAGQEVVQVYVAPATSRVQRPDQELRAFSKLSLDAGERRAVELRLDPRDFAIWDVVSGTWLMEAGAYEIRVGASSRDIRVRSCWTVDREQALILRGA